ncbi:MAG: hypothetical protein JSV80_00955, partial [Acidobacteriota bacterium]
ETVLERLRQASAPAAMIGEQIPRLAHTANRVLADRSGAVPLEEVLGEIFTAFEEQFVLSEDGHRELREQLTRVRGQLPDGARLLALSDQTVISLYAAAIEDLRREREVCFVDEVHELIRGLEQMLRVDDGHAPEAQSSDTLSASLGSAGSSYLDMDALAKTLPTPRGPQRLAPERRARIERARDVLRHFAEHEPERPAFVVLHSGMLEKAALPPTARLIEHPDALTAAVGLFDGLAAEAVDVFRAARVARLELESNYDAAHHDVALAQLDWRALTAEELRCLPPLVVCDTSERLRGVSFAAFSELLRSGRPVHVLIADRTSDIRPEESWEALASYHPSLGYLAIAHREDFVLQSTLALPERLAEGLRRMCRALRPSAAFVTVPAWHAPTPAWLQLAAAHEGRAAPCFRYDPDAGTSWADRFDLSDNPEPVRPWPERTIAYLDENGAEKSLPSAFTYAHAIALDPAYREHFRVIPTEAWHDEQVPIHGWLELDDNDRAQRLPYLWIVDDQNQLARAVMTREVAFACVDRMRAWHILQELAGTDNEYARRAADTATELVLAETQREREALEKAHTEELEKVRAQAATEAMEKLATVLLELDTSAMPTTPAARSAPSTAPPAEPAAESAAAEPAEPVEEEEEEVVSFDEPYIDSPLCSTCNDCLNINKEMFRYNANKQAYIADASAGTFEQLVLAAEKCPSRCIHPGKPREDDPTVTDDLLRRAARFR